MQTAAEIVAAINALPVSGTYRKDRMIISAMANKPRGSRTVQSVTVQWCYVHSMNDVSRATAIAVRGRVLTSELVNAINNSIVRARVGAALQLT